MDGLIDLITSGRLFRQITEYAWTRRGTGDREHLEFQDPSIFENAEDGSSPLGGSIEEPRVTEGVGSASGIADANESPRMDCLSPAQEATDYIHPSNRPAHIQALAYATAADKLPLTAKYSELFTFVGKDNEVGTGVSLTEVMVWQFNAVFQSEQKTADYISRINAIAGRRAIIEKDIAEINSQLEDLPEGYETFPALLQGVIQDRQELETLTQAKDELDLEIQGLERAIAQVREDIQYVQKQLFSDWKETLAEGGLLEPYVAQDETEARDSQVADDLGVELQPQPSPTPSQVERYAIEDAREAALNEITQKTIQLQDTQQRFDSLPELYRKEHDLYIAAVQEGTVTISKSDFDRAMLLDSREATKLLIQAEEELEQACKHARELGLTLSSYDQESCFVDYPDDGYRESLENLWIAHVDRDRIERWMASEDEKPEEIECDEWDSKTVEIWDSVSAIADTPKDRKRIDHWRSICEGLDVEMTDQADLDCEMTDF